MSVNNYRPHLLVLPEDDANSQLANGFALEVTHDRKIQILPAAGGWLSACEKFASDHVKGLRNYPGRHLVLSLDFDGRSDRADRVAAHIPEDVRDRVFLLGVQSEPEKLAGQGLGSLDEIGRALGRECRDGARSLWAHELLCHNATELGRLDRAVRDLLF